jgi:hypothetical protein
MKTVCTTVVLILLSMPAFAQVRGSVGIGARASSTPSLQLVYHATDRLAIRPEVSFVHSTIGQDDALAGRTVPGDLTEIRAPRDFTETRVGGSVGVLWYLQPLEETLPVIAPVRMYLGASLGYTNLSADVPVVEVDFQNGIQYHYTVVHASTGQVAVQGLLGFQYAFSSRFNAIGEVAVEYLSGHEINSLTGSTPKVSRFTTINPGVGVVFYLN